MRSWAKLIPLDVRRKVANIQREELRELDENIQPRQINYCPLGLALFYMTGQSSSCLKRPGESAVAKSLRPDLSYGTRQYDSMHWALQDFMKEFDAGYMNRGAVADALGVRTSLPRTDPWGS